MKLGPCQSGQGLGNPRRCRGSGGTSSPFLSPRALESSQPPLSLPSHAPQIYYHGEPISVNVHVTNNTNKTVKKIKISGTRARASQGVARRDSSQGSG